MITCLPFLPSLSHVPLLDLFQIHVFFFIITCHYVHVCICLFCPYQGQRTDNPAVLCGLLLNSFIFDLGLTPHRLLFLLPYFIAVVLWLIFPGMFKHLLEGRGVEGGKD